MRMLEKLEESGLTTAVVDFGPLLLLFTKSLLGNYRFEFTGN